MALPAIIQDHKLGNLNQSLSICLAEMSKKDIEKTPPEVLAMAQEIATLELLQVQKLYKFANSEIWQNITSFELNKNIAFNEISDLNRTVCFKDVQDKLSIALLKRINDDALFSILEAFTLYTLDAMGIKNASRAQIDTIVDVISDQHWATIPEILLIIKQGRERKYGENYNKLTAELVSKWFFMYKKDERDTYYVVLRDNESKAFKSDKRDFDPQVSKTISVILNQTPKSN